MDGAVSPFSSETVVPVDAVVVVFVTAAVDDGISFNNISTIYKRISDKVKIPK